MLERQREWEFQNSMVLFNLTKPQPCVDVHSVQLIEHSNLFAMRKSWSSRGRWSMMLKKMGIAHRWNNCPPRWCSSLLQDEKVVRASATSIVSHSLGTWRVSPGRSKRTSSVEGSALWQGRTCWRMGIDFGHVDTMLHLSFLGSTSTIWQQGGPAIEGLCGHLCRLRQHPEDVFGVVMN